MQQPLSDGSIYIKPSAELIAYIKSLSANDLINAPINIRKINGQNTETIAHKTNPKPYKTNLDAIKSKYKSKVPKRAWVKYLEFKYESKPQRDHLEIHDLVWLREYIRPQTGVYLHDILKNSVVILPKNGEKPRDPALKRRCAQLKAQQRNLEYNQMTKNVDNRRVRLPEDTVAFQMKEINKQLIGVLQFLISVAAGFAFGFIGLPLLVGDMDLGYRILWGVSCAIIIAIAEIYFLLKKLNDDCVAPGDDDAPGKVKKS